MGVTGWVTNVHMPCELLVASGIECRCFLIDEITTGYALALKSLGYSIPRRAS